MSNIHRRNFIKTVAADVAWAGMGHLAYDPASGYDITPEETVVFREEAVEAVEKLLYTANKYKLHVSLNLHRAPGFCINAGFREPFNLWKDEPAQ